MLPDIVPSVGSFAPLGKSEEYVVSTVSTFSTLRSSTSWFSDCSIIFLAFNLINSSLGFSRGARTLEDLSPP